MDREFLKNYMKKVISLCHKRGALATGGMAAHLLNPDTDNSDLIDSVCQAKLKEINAGADGFLVYDLNLVEPLHQLWSKPVQTGSEVAEEPVITGSSLLKIPTGGATMEGLEHNIAVGILFIHSWISDGKGSFHFKGFVEDSATAEISRSHNPIIHFYFN
jgi:malate synthase